MPRAYGTLFNIKSLGKYSDLYLKTDILLLADVFESFRKRSMEAYSIDPSHFYTTPGFAWNAMLKHTGVKLELLTDVDMLMMVEKGIRGGISMAVHRHAKANCPYMDDFDGQEQLKSLLYVDCNNLYGSSMLEYLPVGEFEWLDEEKFKKKNFGTCRMTHLMVIL